MSDSNIPELCRTCKHCERFHPIEYLMYSWVPWKYNCKYKAECRTLEKEGKFYENKNS